MKHRIALFMELDTLKTLIWNIRCHSFRGLRLRVYPSSHLYISRKANLQIENGLFDINKSWFNGRSRRYISELRMLDGACLHVLGNFSLVQGASIHVGGGGNCILHGGNSFLNTNSTINCFHRIEIGEGCSISDNVSITDSDSHIINGNYIGMTSPVIIKDHVWIGKNVTILKGVTIGEGAVVGAGSVVVKDVPAHSLVVGTPAHVVKENVIWQDA